MPGLTLSRRLTEADLAPLATLAAALQAAPVAPRAEFRDALRARLAAAAAAPPAPARSPDRAPALLDTMRRTRMRLLGAGLVTTLGGVGMVTAADRSLPGQPLYRVKTGAESVQLWLAHGDLERGRRHLQFAATRLAELRRLLEAGSSQPDRLDTTLRGLDTDARAAARELDAAGRHGNPNALPALQRSISRQAAELSALLPGLPAAVQGQARATLALLDGLRSDTTAVAPGSTRGRPPVTAGPAGTRPAAATGAASLSRPPATGSRPAGDAPEGSAGSGPATAAPAGGAGGSAGDGGSSGRTGRSRSSSGGVTLPALPPAPALPTPPPESPRRLPAPLSLPSPGLPRRR